MSTQKLSLLFHNRWSILVLAELGRAGGGRFANLVRRLPVSRESLRRTLGTLLETGLVARNPGHGHPLRPDYVLTPEGARVAPACAALVAALREQGLDELGRKKWSMPVLFALASGPSRFSEIRAALGTISPRALALALKDLEAAGVIERSVVGAYPPSAEYGLAAPARPLAELLAPLAA